MLEQLFPDSLFLGPGDNIRVPDEGYLTSVLDTHDPEQPAIALQAPENNAVANLGPELFKRHVGLMPPILWYHAFIGLGRVVNDFKYGIVI
jgi:hypothetical protein